MIEAEDNTTSFATSLLVNSDSVHTSGTKGFQTGLEVYAVNHDAGNVTNLIGQLGSAQSYGAGAVTNLAASQASVVLAGNGNVTDAAALNVLPATDIGAGAFTNLYGLRIANQTAGTNNWAIQTGLGKVQFGDTLYAKAISEVRYADQFTGANAGAKIAAAIAALPATGGTVDARGLEDAQTISSQILIAKPVTLLLGAATFTCTSGVGANACIKATAAASIIGLQSHRNVNNNTSHGTVLLAGSGFTNYLVEFSTTTHFSANIHSQLQGILLNGNGKAADAVRISNSFGTTLRDVAIYQPDAGVVLENTSSLWTEGTHLDNLWIYDPGTVGIDFVLNGGTVSFDNLKWGAIYLNLLTNGAVGIRVPATATISNSQIDYLKIWTSAQNALGMDFDGSATGTVIGNFEFEGQGGSGNVAWDASGAVQPMTLAFRVAGSGLSGTPVVAGNSWANTVNVYSLVWRRALAGAQLEHAVPADLLVPRRQ